MPTAFGAIAGTWTHRADSLAAAPAALIIGGSGPTDRDGNSAADPAVIDNLETVANWLAADGIATPAHGQARFRQDRRRQHHGVHRQ